MQVTRYTALGVALTLVDANIRAISENWAKLMPQVGCEGMWDFLREVERHLREMMVENRPGETAKGDAGQHEVGQGKGQDAAHDAGQVGHADGGEPPAGAVAGEPGAGGMAAGHADELGAPDGVPVVSVGGKQMEVKTLAERLAWMMGGRTPPHHPSGQSSVTSGDSSFQKEPGQSSPAFGGSSFQKEPKATLNMDRDGQVRML